MPDKVKFYGLDLSYFTGKVEAFLRYREIPHERIELSTKYFRMIGRKTGHMQMPALEWPDGRWMTDSTPMIAWLDAHTPGHRVIPEYPFVKFFSLLVEDYADEWLWRPALHFRWSHQPDKDLMSYRIAVEMMHDVPLPLFLRKALIGRRQIRRYVNGDGVTPANRGHVESIYLRNLAFLENILTRRPFLLGSLPTIADFGYFASMFRHFGLDPTPARLMRDQAPNVYEWVARLWNAKSSRLMAVEPPATTIPDDWDPILKDVGQCYLPYLNANAHAYSKGQRSFDLTIEDAHYHLPVHPYRVYCLEQLQMLFESLPSDARKQVQGRLEKVGAMNPIWAQLRIKSGWDDRGRQPA